MPGLLRPRGAGGKQARVNPVSANAAGMVERRHPISKPITVRRLADLQAAFDRDEIDILFQPQVEMASGEVTGVEALARWRHPELGELSPARLFEIATRSDIITALSRHIQERALKLAAQWPPELGELRLSVNVTSEDIAEADFADEIMARIGRSGFAAERLTLEITEAGLIADLDRAAQLLQDLRKRGVRFAIDDFGTGYSSLAYLKALPLDYLKIDHHFAQDICGSDKARIIVSSVIAMARALGLQVIAEGVENERQRGLLAKEGCEYYQGFHFAPPLDTSGLIRLLKR